MLPLMRRCRVQRNETKAQIMETQHTQKPIPFPGSQAPAWEPSLGSSSFLPFIFTIPASHQSALPPPHNPEHSNIANALVSQHSLVSPDSDEYNPFFDALPLPIRLTVGDCLLPRLDNSWFPSSSLGTQPRKLQLPTFHVHQTRVTSINPSIPA